MKRIIVRFFEIIFLTTQRFFKENYGYHVSALSFETLLAIVPFLSVSTFIAAHFVLFSNFINLSEDYILKSFIPTAAISIKTYFIKFIAHVMHLPIFSMVFLVFTAVMLIYTIDDTLSTIWQRTTRRKNIVTWIIYCLIILVTPIFIGFSLFLTTYLISFPWLSKVSFVLLFLAPILINTLLFSFIYMMSSNFKLKWQNCLLGGFMAAILFEIAKFLFSFYIARSSYQLIYGVFATIPIFLVWLYICWFIVLWGALFTHTSLQKRKTVMKK